MTVFIGPAPLLSLTYEYLTSVLSFSAREFSLGATKELFLNRGSVQSIIPNPDDRIPHNADSKRLEMVIKTSRFLICSATMYGGRPYRTSARQCDSHKKQQRRRRPSDADIKHVGMQSLLSMSSINRGFCVQSLAGESFGDSCI